MSGAASAHEHLVRLTLLFSDSPRRARVADLKA